MKRQLYLYKYTKENSVCLILYDIITKNISISQFYIDRKKINCNQIKWRKNNPLYDLNWRKNNPEKIKKYYKKYIRTTRGKETYKKALSKRQRNLGFNIIYSNILNEEFIWHHVNDNDVIAIPEDLHLLYYGKNHRENLEYIIEQIYERR